ncbi:MAG: aspartate carbamoyltransferase [Candidatus Micrarchaeota archaeon]
MQDLISFKDLKKEDADSILSSAKEMEENLYKKYSLHKGKLATLAFFEPSTRTSLSFQAAARRLGIEIINYSHNTSSSKKGESFEDTIKMFDGYSDVIILRHPDAGSAQLAADVANSPVINAGDGANQHPTQALIDLYTIQKKFGKIENLNISLVGDLKYGRTVHSLIYALAMHNANITLISPKELEMDLKIIENVKKKFNAKLTLSQKIDAKNADVIYMTRIQKERFTHPLEAEKMQGSYSLSSSILKNAKKEMIILHPLPRLEEIPAEIDSSPHAYYFKQAHNGVPVRMAILHHCLSR